MRFYVYELIDPRTELPFYVGKGTGSRVSQHENDAKRGKSGPRLDRIREIWIDGWQIERRIVQRFASEADAYAFEAKRIDELGLHALTNLAPGGGSVRLPDLAPFRWTKLTARKHMKTVARALAWMAVGRISLGPYDLTDAIKAMIGKMVDDLGVATFTDLATQAGITVRQEPENGSA